jgi:hypothetical protein
MAELSENQWEYLLIEHPKKISQIFGNEYSSQFRIHDFYHYTSLRGLQGIIGNRNLWFTDCEYLNDSTEYVHAIDVLAAVIDEITNKYEMDFIDSIRISDKKPYETIESILFSRKEDKVNSTIGSEDHICRRFVFCGSVEQDKLSIWNYYSKSDTGDGFSLGLNFPGLGFFVNPQLNDHQCIFSFGKVLYTDIEKRNLLKELIAVEHNAWKEHNIPLRAICRDFRQNFNDIRLLFKRPDFSHESEMRIVATIPKQNLQLCVPINRITYRTREVKGITIPYVEMPFPIASIYSIVAGPTVDDTTLGNVRELIGQKEMVCEITKSSIPLRY